ncbi:hypothetical protein [Bacteroides pyogenes]|uniref:hypothetical protein n=1 Tax=Bacteroides pyogenes TaxID=310300 RepID=UPI0011DCFA66|nr:hypothetical protein [Bacteroides pyogenes]
MKKKNISKEFDYIEENLLNYIKGGNSSIDQDGSSDCCGLQFSCNHRGKKEEEQASIQFS